MDVDIPRDRNDEFEVKVIKNMKLSVMN